MKYRTTSESYVVCAFNTLGGLDGAAMKGININNDGNWHILVVDLSAYMPTYVQKNNDGEYVLKWARFDILDKKAETGSIDIAYVAITDNLAGVAAMIQEGDAAICDHKVVSNPVWNSDRGLYVCQCVCGEITKEVLHTSEARSKNDSTNGITVTQEDGFVRYTVSKQATKDDYYFYPLTGGSSVTGRYLLIKYRLVNNFEDATPRTFYAGSAMSAYDAAKGGDAGDGKGNVGSGSFIGDGQWHYYIVSVDDTNKQFIKNSDGTYSWKYLRLGLNPAAYDGTCYMDIDQLIFVDCEEAVEAYMEKYPLAEPETTVKSISHVSGIYKADGSYIGFTPANYPDTPIEVLVTEGITQIDVKNELKFSVVQSDYNVKIWHWTVIDGDYNSTAYRILAADGTVLADWASIASSDFKKGTANSDANSIVESASKVIPSTTVDVVGKGGSIANVSEFAGQTVVIEYAAVAEGAEDTYVTFCRLTNVEVPAAPETT